MKKKLGIKFYYYPKRMYNLREKEKTKNWKLKVHRNGIYGYTSEFCSVSPAAKK